jgi:hypothetical protein
MGVAMPVKFTGKTGAAQFRPEDEVIYKADPLLFGRMIVQQLRKDGRWDCVVDAGLPSEHAESFDVSELVSAPARKAVA